jgi:hypothetical protein
MTEVSKRFHVAEEPRVARNMAVAKRTMLLRRTTAMQDPQSSHVTLILSRREMRMS